VLYAREGAKVAAVDLDRASVEETRSIILAEGGYCDAYQGDVTSTDSIRDIVASTAARLGAIDILHNNVGITAMGDVTELGEERWSQALDINLTSIFRSCKYVIPVMLEQGRGAIVNISSLASIQINAYPYPSYAAAKAGLNQLTRSIAVRYAPMGIRANAVLPGVMDTPLIHRQITGQFESAEAMLSARHAASPMGRMGDAWDVASAAIFLASDESRYITGVCLPVDGGKSCAGR
jgi:NAD(P)-dependent dehydrogenase (short-subunit alcohol dehydrogenase family)